MGLSWIGPPPESFHVLPFLLTWLAAIQEQHVQTFQNYQPNKRYIPALPFDATRGDGELFPPETKAPSLTAPVSMEM